MVEDYGNDVPYQKLVAKLKSSPQDEIEPPPIKPSITSSRVILVGLILYCIAITYPSLLLVLTVILSQVVPYIFRINDDGESRRRAWKKWEKENIRPQEWKDLLFNKDHPSIDLQESYWVNSRGMLLSTSVMRPKKEEVKAVICFCHGFNDNASYMQRLENQRLVKEGYAVVTIEYEGHGRSDGLLSYIPNWNNLIDDTSSYFEEITQTHFPQKNCFLMGASMGGAICYYIYERNPKFWSGILFLSPMLKVSDEFLPPENVIKICEKFVGPQGTYSPLGWLPVTPTPEVNGKSFKLQWKRYIIMSFPSLYGRRPRLATARELLLVTRYISKNLQSFDAPFILFHGLDDKVTCPKLSELFYNECNSKDKEIKLYKGYCHSMVTGEEDQQVEKIYVDMLQWLKQRI